ncbi:MAG: restriction endonuclease subunit S [Phycisphaeraceae bacterium]|nr:restriction endonuclease subunit S [Phycisphaeraceae bacterium]QYK48963.1 MAG: restriction endonuclease subunit S [Phycisphaeraceae bacterium]
MPRITCATADRLTRHRLEAGDIVFARRGAQATGLSALVEQEHEGAICGTGALRLRIHDKVNVLPEYLSFALIADVSRSWLRTHAVGAVMPNLNEDVVRRLPIRLPPLPEQRAIAGVLGALDDKIEVNRKTARVLEGIARAVFTSWFVDFDPVRYNIRQREHAALGRAGRFVSTGDDITIHDAAGNLVAPAGDAVYGPIAHLFPDRLVDSPLGEVPEGWRVVAMPEVFEVNPTRSLSKGVDAAYLDMSNMPTQGHAPAEWVRRAVGSGMRFKNGDTLVARITPCLENGKTAFVDFLADGEVAWGSTEYIVLRPKSPLPPVFAYLLARSERFRTHAIQAMTGSSGRQRVPAESLDHFLIAVPTVKGDTIASKFATIVEPMFARMSLATQQNRTLAALRDTLLPKLISGELRIADAEQIVGRLT